MEKTFIQQHTNLLKVVLFGPESTGKTTLAQDLANTFKTNWAPEYARIYLQNKWNHTKTICEEIDLIPIVTGQLKLENELASSAEKILFCDTNILETAVYAQYYFNRIPEPILHGIQTLQYDLYLLTDIDVPWEADDLRDRPNDRKQLFDLFKNTLEQNNFKYITLTGNQHERLKTATYEINKLINNVSEPILS